MLFGCAEKLRQQIGSRNYTTGGLFNINGTLGRKTAGFPMADGHRLNIKSLG